jgi:hypothetical protein
LLLEWADDDIPVTQAHRDTLEAASVPEYPSAKEFKRNLREEEREGQNTHDAVDNRVLSKQDDLPRGTDKPLQLLVAIQIEVVHRATECIGVADSDKLVLCGV